MRIFLLLLVLSFQANAGEQPYSKLLLLTGIEEIAGSLDADLQRAITRHAQRCDATPAQVQLSPERMVSTMTADLKQRVTFDEVQKLAEWYETSTGRKITQLEQGDINDVAMQQYQSMPARADQVMRLYENTSAGDIGASIAGDLEHAGWVASGCLQKLRSGGDNAKTNAEEIYGGLLKDQGDTLEILFRQGTLHAMEFMLSPLTVAELSEYTETTERSQAVFGALVNALRHAIQSEVDLFEF